jgi:hypothetical protein
MTMATEPETIARCRTVYDHLVESTGKVPSRGAVARAVGISPSTVERLWMELSGELDGMAPRQIVQAAQRRCLACRTAYRSTWAGDRICRPCRKHEAWRSGDHEYSTSTISF